MKRFKVALFAAVLGLVLATGTNARAALVDWSDNWTPIVAFVLAPGGSHVNFANLPTTSYQGSSQTVMTNLSVTTSFDASSPDVFTNQNFKLSSVITDTASGHSHQFDFTGTMSGYLSKTAVSASVTWLDGMGNPISNPIETAKIGNNTYTVNLLPFGGINVPGSLPSSINANVTVTAGNPIQGHGTPEPSTMLMGCMGLSFLGFASWRKRKNRQAA